MLFSGFSFCYFLPGGFLDATFQGPLPRGLWLALNPLDPFRLNAAVIGRDRLFIDPGYILFIWI